MAQFGVQLTCHHICGGVGIEFHLGHTAGKHAVADDLHVVNARADRHETHKPMCHTHVLARDRQWVLSYLVSQSHRKGAKSWRCVLRFECTHGHICCL